MKIDAFHYVQLGTAYRSVLPRPGPMPPPYTRAPLWTGGLSAPTQGPPACARRRGDRALWGHPAHPPLPDERLLWQGRCPPPRGAVPTPSPPGHTALGSPGLEGLLSQHSFPRALPSSSSWTSSRCQRWRCSPVWWTTSWATAWSLTKRTSTRM